MDSVTLLSPSSKPREKQFLFSTVEYAYRDGRDGIFPGYIITETRFLFFE